jgi:xanthine dehydrogenase small subunit
MGSPTSPIEFLLNGRPVSIEHAQPQRTLLDELRARGLTGAKEGCAEGECGACTVVMVARHGDRTAYHAVNSCLMFLPMAAGHELRTVESLAVDGEPAEAQLAMAAAGGSQCGYCTPGFVMSLFAEQYRPDRDGACDPHALGGNLCRCTGYRPIRDAALSLGEAPAGALRDRLTQAPPRLGAARSVGFTRPTTIEDAIELLSRDEEAVVIAGGTDLAVEANLRGKRWLHLVSVEAIDEMQDVAVGDDLVRIGAAVPLDEIGRRWHRAPSVVMEWLTLFASPPIRNRATLGGNLVTASPIGDAAPLLLAMDARVALAGVQGRRTIPLATFFTGYRTTALQPGELLVSVEIPLPLPRLLRFYKIAKRRFDDISTVAAAFAVDATSSGEVARARLAFGGVAATPVRVQSAEAALEGQRWDEASVRRARGLIESALTPMSDHRGSREFRHQVSGSLLEKFWWEARA